MFPGLTNCFPGPEQRLTTNCFKFAQKLFQARNNTRSLIILSLSGKALFQSRQKARSTIMLSWGSCPLFESVEPSPGLLNRDLSLLLKRQNTRRTWDRKMIIGIHPSRRPRQKHCGHDEELWFYVLDKENLWRYGHRCHDRRGHLPLRQGPRRPRWRYLRLLQRLRQRQRLRL